MHDTPIITALLLPALIDKERHYSHYRNNDCNANLVAILRHGSDKLILGNN